ncbi:hypothetical protein N7490_007556 [Penicillium lividum]|nr:hypothetical protein N7490_007556 [Penicillium lividum]
MQFSHHAAKAERFRANNLQDEISRLRMFLPQWSKMYESGNQDLERSKLSISRDMTIFHMAAAANLTDMMDYLLLSENESSTQLDGGGCTPLYWAAKMGHIEIAEILHI